ncbi:hypothetical protein HPP92_010825 [Vanilla planifolia]|uniref:Uncharacterized protein n=1 Tax=Vanilla planifolia TaxID=51239 RepID=A0A835R5Y6_VANPL|nr:hypothetical protein HPP92_010825 [Vanilla planifolia]
MLQGEGGIGGTQGGEDAGGDDGGGFNGREGRYGGVWDFGEAFEAQGCRIGGWLWRGGGAFGNEHCCGRYGSGRHGGGEKWGPAAEVERIVMGLRMRTADGVGLLGGS